MKLSRRLSYDKAAEIGQQQYFDALKHVTTLSTGTIVILATFLEKVFTASQWKWLAGACFILLALSVVTSVAMMFWHTLSAEEDLGTLTRDGFRAYFALAMLSAWSFGLGIVCLANFVIKNL